MELIAIVFMLVGGGIIAVFVLIAMTIAQKEAAHAIASGGPQPLPERDQIAASILYHVVAAGGVPHDEVLRTIRRGAGLAAPVTRGIDIANWATSYANLATPEQRASLLETAVQLIASRERAVPLRQYAALLDLSFSLGFQTDALAKLRQVYGFDYVDHAQDGRPRDAERAPLYVRDGGHARELLSVLEIGESEPSKQSIVSAYRKLAVRYHPDRFFGRPAEEQSGAAAKFIEITRAYETLLTFYRD